MYIACRFFRDFVLSCFERSPSDLSFLAAGFFRLKDGRFRVRSSGTRRTVLRVAAAPRVGARARGSTAWPPCNRHPVCPPCFPYWTLLLAVP
jgi:hypothetical protein